MSSTFGDAAKQRDGGRVVARHEGGDLGDAGRAGVRDQLRGERRADAALLVLVGDREGDLGAAAVANEPRDRDRLRVALDVRDERMTGRGRPEASCPSSDALRRGFGPLKRARRDCSPRRSKGSITVRTSPWRRGLARGGVRQYFGLSTKGCT